MKVSEYRNKSRKDSKTKEDILKQHKIEYYTLQDILTDTPTGQALKKLFENNYL